VGYLFHVAAIQIHGINIQIAIAHTGKHNFISLWRNSGFCIIAWRIGQAFGDVAFKDGHKNIVAVIYRPHILLYLVSVWHRRAGIHSQMGRCIKEVFMIGHQVGTGSAAPAGAHAFIGKLRLFVFGYLAVKYLVALQALGRVGALKGDVRIVKTKIRFRIIATYGQLAHILKVLFIRIGEVFLLGLGKAAEQ